MTSAITTHVLDTAIGRPASGIAVQLAAASDQSWELLAEGVTDDDGRIRELGPEHVNAGHYRLTFDTARYFSERGEPAFFPEVSVTFVIADPAAHYHVPILLSPFAFSTYRGS